MKKISNELKVGVIALLTLIVFIWLYNFLKGKNLFSNSVHYYAVYDMVGGLAESSPVEVNGYKVGVVQSIRFLDPESGKLLVVMTVDRSFKLPLNTVAEITTASLIAGMKIQFVYGSGPGVYSSGDTIPGRMAESILSKVENELTPLNEKVTNLIAALDTLIRSVSEILNPQFRKDVRTGVASLSNTLEKLDKSGIDSSIAHINRFTAMLSDNSDKFARTLDNVESFTDTLTAADLYSSVNNLKSGLEIAAQLMDKMNKGEGTAGQLMTNDSLYRNLSSSLRSLNLLLQDMKVNPKKYVHFSLFGRKNSPEQ